MWTFQKVFMHEIKFHLYKRSNKGYDVIASCLSSSELEETLSKIPEEDFWNLDILPIRFLQETKLKSYEECSY